MDDYISIALLGSTGMSHGSLIKLIHTTNWKADSVFSFPDEPVCVASNRKGESYIVTQTSIFEFKKELKTIFDKGFWGYNQLSSCAVNDENEIFLGLENGVVKYSQRLNEIAWLSPKFDD